jgi:CheY-specific phosphatase CheX
MTSPKGAHRAAFSPLLRNLMVDSVQSACAALGLEVRVETPFERNAMVASGDYIAGIRVVGNSFQGSVTLLADKALAIACAEKIFAQSQAKIDDLMLCDLVGELCNQMTGVLQRTLGQKGCVVKVDAQKTSQSLSGLELGISPQEWLLVPFKFGVGGGFFCFGYVGDFAFGEDEVQENLTDARNITFFE